MDGGQIVRPIYIRKEGRAGRIRSIAAREFPSIRSYVPLSLFSAMSVYQEGRPHRKDRIHRGQGVSVYPFMCSPLSDTRTHKRADETGGVTNARLEALFW